MVDFFSGACATNFVQVLPDYWRIRFSVLEAAVKAVVANHGATVRQESVIVGFTPEAALAKTLAALEQGRSCCVTSISTDHM